MSACLASKQRTYRACVTGYGMEEGMDARQPMSRSHASKEGKPTQFRFLSDLRTEASGVFIERS